MKIQECGEGVFLWNWEHRKRKVGSNKYLNYNDVITAPLPSSEGDTHTESLWMYEMGLQCLLVLLKTVGRI